jgi:hypothetical protein
MRKINKNSRRGIVNLLADFILTRIDKKENSIIQVTDCEAFMVIHGQTTSKDILDLDKIKADFFEWFKDILDKVGIENINTIDIIRYDQEVGSIEKGWVSVNKEVFVEEPEPIHELNVSSEFPYGYSLNCGRLMTYYSHYVFNHMYSLMGVDNVNFYFTKEEDENEDLKIKIVSDSKYNKEIINSLVLDVFSFDLEDFKDYVKNYDLLQDILFPGKDKPYTKQDKLEHVIVF